MAETQVLLNCVGVSSSDSFDFNVTSGLEVGDDALDTSLGDTNAFGDIPNPRFGLAG